MQASCQYFAQTSHMLSEMIMVSQLCTHCVLLIVLYLTRVTVAVRFMGGKNSKVEQDHTSLAVMPRDSHIQRWRRVLTPLLPHRIQDYSQVYGPEEQRS